MKNKSHDLSPKILAKIFNWCEKNEGLNPLADQYLMVIHACNWELSPYDIINHKELPHASLTRKQINKINKLKDFYDKCFDLRRDFGLLILQEIKESGCVAKNSQ